MKRQPKRPPLLLSETNGDGSMHGRAALRGSRGNVKGGMTIGRAAVHSPRHVMAGSAWRLAVEAQRTDLGRAIGTLPS